MHNKLMVADNTAAIVGGRNIGDVYYGVDSSANFRDLDVLTVGSVVPDLSAVFHRFWNSASTVPIAKIVQRTYGAVDLDGIRRHHEDASIRPIVVVNRSRNWCIEVDFGEARQENQRVQRWARGLPS